MLIQILLLRVGHVFGDNNSTYVVIKKLSYDELRFMNDTYAIFGGRYSIEVMC